MKIVSLVAFSCVCAVCSLVARAAATLPAVTYPKYVVTVEQGASIALKGVSSVLRYASADAEAESLTYAQFTGEARTGTLVKSGAGTLTFDAAIPDFDGPVHIAEGVAIGICSNCFGKTVSTRDPSTNERVWVYDGATLVMDDVLNSYYQESQSFYFTGDGAPGMGGSFVARRASGTTYWPFGSKSRAYGGSVRIFVDVSSGTTVGVTWGCPTPVKVNARSSSFSLDGVDTVMYGRSPDSVFALDASGLGGINHLIVSNLTLRFGGNSSNVQASNNTTSEIRFKGGARLHFNKSTNHNINETLYHKFNLVIDDLEYAKFEQTTSGYCGWDPWGGTTNLWWYGPVTLNGDFRLNNPCRSIGTVGRRQQGFTWSGKVTGPGGIRPWCDSSGTCTGDKMGVNLLGTENDFTGGIVLSGGSRLGVWRNGAVPTQEGAGLVSLTNSHVMFGLPPTQTQWDVFSMPVTEFVGSGTVTNGTGRWKALVKKGAGTLDYNSQLDGDALDLQGGTVKFNTACRAAYTDTNKPAGYAAALPAFTTLTGTAGTLDLGTADTDYSVTHLAGTPAVTNGNLTVTGTWTVDAVTFGQGSVRVFGALTFASGATLALTGDLANAPHPGAQGYLVAKAASVTGLPAFRGGNWQFVAADGEVRLHYIAGTTLIVR